MKNRTSLMLIEQVIALLVFALAAALCLRLFVWADTASREQRRHADTMVWIQNSAEVVSHHKGDLQGLVDTLGGSREGSIWQRQMEGFTLRVSLLEAKPYLGSAKVCALSETGEVLMELTVCWQEEIP